MTHTTNQEVEAALPTLLAEQPIVETSSDRWQAGQEVSVTDTNVHAETPTIDLTLDPNTLSLEKIPAYVKAVGRRMAVDAWLVGKALARAKKLVQEAHRAGWREEGWREWCAGKLGVSHETARKWIKIAEQFGSKDKLEGLTLEEAYSATGSKKTRKVEAKNPQEEASKEEQKPAQGTPAPSSTIQGEVHKAPADAGGSVVTAPPTTDEPDVDDRPDTAPDGTVVTVASTVVEESDEDDSLDDEDWGDVGTTDDEDWGDGFNGGEGREAIGDLLDTSFKHLDGVNGANTLADAKAAAKCLRSCLIRLAEALDF